MSKNKQTHLEKISKGIAIYKVGASPFWYVRLWNVATKAYTVRTTKCSIKAEAIEEAYAIKNKLKGTQSLTAAPKHFSFEHFARQQMQIQQRLVNAGQRNSRFVTDDIAILERSEDGILSYLGHRDIRKISARDIREYLQLLDQRRQAPLSADTLKRHLVLIRKILHLAREDGVLVEIPSFPKISKKDAPRPSFTPCELKTLCQKIEEISRVSGLVARGTPLGEQLGVISDNFISMFDRFPFPSLEPDLTDPVVVNASKKQSDYSAEQVEIVQRHAPLFQVYSRGYGY